MVAGVSGPHEQPECGERERRDEDVGTCEPRVVHEDGVRGEQDAEDDDLEVPEVVAVQPRGDGEEAADDGDGESHDEVGRAEEFEQEPVDVVQQRAVRDRPVLEDAGRGVSEDVVAESRLAPVRHPFAEREHSRERAERGDREEYVQRGASVGPTSSHRSPSIPHPVRALSIRVVERSVAGY